MDELFGPSLIGVFIAISFWQDPPKFKVVSLFAGILGLDIGTASLGSQCPMCFRCSSIFNFRFFNFTCLFEAHGTRGICAALTNVQQDEYTL